MNNINNLLKVTMEQNPKIQSKEQPDLNQNTSQKITSTNPSTSSEKEEVVILNKGVNTNIIQNKLQTKTNQNKGAVGNTIRKIRTYKEDIAEAIRSQKASLTSIAAAEQKRRANIPTDVTKDSSIDFKKVGVIFGIVALITLGITIIVFFTFFYENKGVVPEQDIPSFFFVEKQKEINITGKSARKILQILGDKRENISLPLGQIAYLYITKTTEESGTEITHVVSAAEFLKDIRMQVSGSFLRSLEPSFMIGIHSFNQNQPFIIFKSNSYQNSFRGLLEWEKTMYSDLFLFFGQNIDPTLKVPIDPQTGKSIVLRENFEDMVIKNVDVRALLSESGDIKLLYAFPNQQTLIITTNENTLIELITRLNSVRVF